MVFQGIFNETEKESRKGAENAEKEEDNGTQRHRECKEEKIVAPLRFCERKRDKHAETQRRRKLSRFYVKIPLKNYSI